MKKRRDTTIAIDCENMALKAENKRLEAALANVQIYLGRDAEWCIPEAKGMMVQLIRICADAGMTYDKALDVTGASKRGREGLI